MNPNCLTKHVYPNDCEPAAALEALPPNCPGKPNCGAAMAAQITANKAINTRILNSTVYNKESSIDKKFSTTLNENLILLGFLYSDDDDRRFLRNNEQESKKKQETH